MSSSILAFRDEAIFGNDALHDRPGSIDRPGRVHNSACSGAGEPIAVVNMDCSEPYAFKQDCSAWTRAARVLRIDQIDVTVAATEDGSTVLAMDARSFRHSMFGYPLLFHSPLHSKKSNAGFQAVRGVLEKNGFSILRAIPVKTLTDDTSGYVFMP